MGLLGGFKAKFTGRDRKSKHVKEVVCVKYNIISTEFDASPSALPSCSNTNPGKNDVIKQRKQPTKPEIKNVFGDNLKVNGEITDTSKTAVKTNVLEKEKTPVKEQNSYGARSTKLKDEPPKKNEVFTNPPASSSKPEESKSMDEPPKENELIKPISSNKSNESSKNTILFGDNLDEIDDDGNFAIHFANNVDYGNSSSGDETDYEDEEPAFNSVNYSSQATSIFFGGEEELTIARPRNIVIDDDQDSISVGSSASA